MQHHVVEAELESLRPTQMTLGYVEVAWKRAEWRRLPQRKRRALLRDHVVPCVAGPGGRRYVVDHHHLCVALLEEKVERVWIHLLEDFSWLEPAAFWRTLEFRRWVHPYDGRGRRREFADLPRRLRHLRDDPHRSLAALVRRAGGFAKDLHPFAEFEWAEYFRAHVPLRRDAPIRDGALGSALRLARAADARYLPGWVGKDGQR